MVEADCRRHLQAAGWGWRDESSSPGHRPGRPVNRRAATDERFGSLDITVADRGDITDRAGLGAVFDRLQPDVVVNAAAYTSVGRGKR